MTAGEDLCLACGLCCDGTIFRHVPVQQAEIEGLRRRRLTVIVEVPPRFGQPCEALLDGRCTIYADRPKACAEFRCRLLQRLESGTLTATACLETIRRVKDLARSLRCALEPSDEAPMALKQLLEERLFAATEADLDARRRNAQLLLDAKMLDLLVRSELTNDRREDAIVVDGDGDGRGTGRR